MTDISQEALRQRHRADRKNLGRQVGRGKITEADKKAEALARIRTTLTLTEALGPTDL
jgi:3-hydroxyacyl-CoA dehydrogenase